MTRRLLSLSLATLAMSCHRDPPVQFCRIVSVSTAERTLWTPAHVAAPAPFPTCLNLDSKGNVLATIIYGHQGSIVSGRVDEGRISIASRGEELLSAEYSKPAPRLRLTVPEIRKRESSGQTSTFTDVRIDYHCRETVELKIDAICPSSCCYDAVPDP